jgi:hypothetical protein
MPNLFSMTGSIFNNKPTKKMLREQLARMLHESQCRDRLVKRLKDQIRQLQNEINDSKVGEFVEHDGALFKRKPEGGYHRVVYCPHCERSAEPISIATALYLCYYCGWRADFTGIALDDIIARLPDAPGNT